MLPDLVSPLSAVAMPHTAFRNLGCTHRILHWLYRSWIVRGRDGSDRHIHASAAGGVQPAAVETTEDTAALFELASCMLRPEPELRPTAVQVRGWLDDIAGRANAWDGDREDSGEGDEETGRVEQ